MEAFLLPHSMQWIYWSIGISYVVNLGLGSFPPLSSLVYFADLILGSCLSLEYLEVDEN